MPATILFDASLTTTVKGLVPSEMEKVNDPVVAPLQRICVKKGASILGGKVLETVTACVTKLLLASVTVKV